MNNLEIAELLNECIDKCDALEKENKYLEEMIKYGLDEEDLKDEH